MNLVNEKNKSLWLHGSLMSQHRLYVIDYCVTKQQISVYRMWCHIECRFKQV